jgi:hypothetical protein
MTANTRKVKSGRIPVRGLALGGGDKEDSWRKTTLRRITDWGLWYALRNSAVKMEIVVKNENPG